MFRNRVFTSSKIGLLYGKSIDRVGGVVWVEFVPHRKLASE